MVWKSLYIIYVITKSKDINKVCLKIFIKLLRNHKATDLSTLRPCRQVLEYHARRAKMKMMISIFVVAILKQVM